MKITLFATVAQFFISFALLASNNCDNSSVPVPIGAGTTLKLMSANIAHGRGRNFSQITTSVEEIKTNLDAIADTINKVNPDIIGFQEIDKASWWSGKFDHVSHLYERTNFLNYVSTSHVTAWWGEYGTALFSKLSLSDCDGVTFAPSWPTTNKGFSYAKINPVNRLQPIYVVSLHLDFSRASVRNKQINELLSILKQVKTPVIIMGDFNTDWRWQNSIVKTLSDNNQLRIFNRDSDTLNTFGSKRLDWIMISHHFEFVSYTSLDSELSDHVFVIAEVKFNEN